MDLLKRILSIFKKENKVKLLDSSKDNAKTVNFLDNIKFIQINKKTKVKTYKSVGDGLGIDTKVEY